MVNQPITLHYKRAKNASQSRALSKQADEFPSSDGDVDVIHTTSHLVAPADIHNNALI